MRIICLLLLITSACYHAPSTPTESQLCNENPSACGNEPAPSSSGGTVTLAIGAIAPAEMPQDGPYTISVPVTLTNVSVSTPIPDAAGDYALITAGGLTIAPTIFSGQSDEDCPVNIAVNEGGHYQCTVDFEVPSGDTPRTIEYDDGAGDQASAAVTLSAPAGPPASCLQAVVAFQSGDAACRDCMQNAEQPCAEQIPGCATDSIQCCNDCLAVGSNSTSTVVCICISNCFPTNCGAQSAAFESCINSTCAGPCG